MKMFIFLLLSLSLSTLNAAKPNYSNPSLSGDIVGKVNICSQSNEGLDIKILGTSFQATTDAEGNYRMSYVQPGTYNLVVMNNGIKLKTISNITVNSKQTIIVNSTELCIDNDNDGYTQSVDCDDNNPFINPGMIEIADNIDNNCNRIVDENLLFDADNDGYSIPDDCNDNDNTIFPGATEVLDGKDNNCNGSIDEGLVEVNLDEDGDGFTKDVDCDDSDPLVNPGALENPFDGIDNDCDGQTDENVLI